MSSGPLGQQNLWRNVFIPAASKTRSSSWAWQPKRQFVPRQDVTKKSGRSWAELMNPEEAT